MAVDPAPRTVTAPRSSRPSAVGRLLPVVALLVATATGATVAACSSPDGSTSEAAVTGGGDAGTSPAPDAGADASASGPKHVEPNYFEGLASHEEQLQVLCDRGGADTVSKAFCAKTPPKITGLADVLSALGLAFKDPSKGNAAGGNPGFALTAHSSSLVVRSVNAANPRAIVFTPPLATGPNPAYVVLGFTRGEQLVELATKDPETGEPAFYLIKYEQACNATKSCTTKDLFGPDTEKNWTGFTLYEDEDLVNTPMDCLKCHQPDAKGKAFLRMQERTAPFTHWMAANREGGRALLADYHEVHGHAEPFGPIPASLVDASDPALLAKFVDQNNGTTLQPNAFDSAAIEAEVRLASPGQPTFNDPPGKSATWQKLFDTAADAKAIRAPYHDVKVTSASKLDAYGVAYRAMGRGQASSLPDPRDLFLDTALEDMGIVPKAGATGEALLVQMCGECHNSRLDPKLSRARFDVTKLDSMPPSEKAAAIARMRLPASDRQHMPPVIFGELTEEQIARAASALQ